MVRTCVGRGGCVQVGEREEAEHGLFVRGTVRPIRNGRAFFGLLPEGGNGGVSFGKGKNGLSVCLSVCRADRRRRVDRMWRARGGDTMVVSSGGNPCGHSAAMRLVRRLLFHGRAETGAFRRFVQARYEKRGRGVYRPCVAEKSDCGRGRA